MHAAADSISHGDILAKKIQTGQNWKLLPDMALASTILPCIRVKGSCGWPRFPGFYGKLSSMKKRVRLIKELREALSEHCQPNRRSVLFDYVPALLNLVISTIQSEYPDATENTLKLLDSYGLTPEFLKVHLNELNFIRGRGKKDGGIFMSVPTKMRSKLTRMFNKRHKTSLTKKKKTKKPKESTH